MVVSQHFSFRIEGSSSGVRSMKLVSGALLYHQDTAAERWLLILDAHDTLEEETLVLPCLPQSQYQQLGFFNYSKDKLYKLST